MTEDGASSDFEGKDVSVLMEEFQEAGEEARYRDRLLFTLYYFSLILVGGMIPVGYELYGEPRSWRGIGALALGSCYALLLLSVWGHKIRRSRNAAWSRKADIENELEDYDVPTPKINSKIRKADEELEDDELEGYLEPLIDRVNRSLFHFSNNWPTDVIAGVLVPLSGLSFVAAVLAFGKAVSMFRVAVGLVLAFVVTGGLILWKWQFVINNLKRVKSRGGRRAPMDAD